MTRYPYALQLYSVRDYCEKDPEAGLYQVKEAGYRHVELAGLYGLEAAEFKALLDAIGLIPVSMHLGYDVIAADVDEARRQAQALGIHYVVVPWLDEDICPDNAHWLMAAAQMDKAGAALRENGIHLCYHNHAHELVVQEGEMPFDLIFSGSDALHLQLELDTCWAKVAEMDVEALMRRYQQRMPLVHIKDCKPPEGQEPIVFTELGRGIMDVPGTLRAAKEAGAKWFIVEQDESEGDSMESAAVNAEFMKQQNL